MEYFKLLQLEREPFSNSPDPDFFFQSRQHVACLQKLELALRLKRGLNVVIGDVGTGKTTLCRELIRRFSGENDIETHLILDPSFKDAGEFLHTLCSMIAGRRPAAALSETAVKEIIKQHLFEKGVDRGRTIVLIIDEGQKITPACTEILRELLNYETNTHKLLQIVLFAQQEFETIMAQQANFADRINLLHYLAPMSFSDTRRMIQHRLKLSSRAAKPAALFTAPALWAIYKASKGYPRRVIHICHQSILAMIIQNKTKAGWAVIRSCKKRLRPSASSLAKKLIWSGGGAAAIVLIFLLLQPDGLMMLSAPEQTAVFKVNPEPESGDPQNSQNSEPETAAASPTLAASLATAAAPVASPPDGASENEPVLKPAAETLAGGQNLSEPPPTAAAPTQPPSSPPAPAAVAEPPALLGSLTVMPGDTVAELVTTVYGTFRQRYLKTVIEANPHISDPDKIAPGDEIHFPALSFDYKIPHLKSNWIILEEPASLVQARKRIDALSSQTRTRLRLIAGWSPTAGLRFQLAVKGYFSSKEAARRYAAGLPESLAGRATIISGWEDADLLYSDPFAGGML